ncbi:DUF1803 domain-containing protein [Streptococcus sp. zg-JUN1979]|uniref:DUF1803 domain-containing protein n=1 Tax=Streptococcus sp. zg-JUN1979 TaxID=3391450 RepID=UPI0039A4642F
MITIINPDKLSSQPFFKALINYLASHDEVTLRQIRADFAEVKHLERQLESYIEAGYILRHKKRYQLSLEYYDDKTLPQLDQMLFVDTTKTSYDKLAEPLYQTLLTNHVNHLALVERTDFLRNRLTLSNYFYKLSHHYPLSEAQEVLYQLLGDVNQDYALKYMTSFLLKLTKKKVVKQKRPDIFVQALVLLGYIEPIDETETAYQAKVVLEELLISENA